LSAHQVERVADRIRRVLAEILRGELRDPRAGFVTITGVDLSADRRHARVYVTVLGESGAQSLRALEHATPFLRRALAGRVGLRFTPQLTFVLDPGEEAGQRVDRILDRLRQEGDPDGPA